MWAETSVLWQLDKTGLRPTKTGLGLCLVGCGLGLGVGLASLLLVLILVLQLWSWSCIFGLIDTEDQDFEQSSVKISKNAYCAPRCCLYIVVDRISHSLNAPTNHEPAASDAPPTIQTPHAPPPSTIPTVPSQLWIELYLASTNRVDVTFIVFDARMMSAT